MSMVVGIVCEGPTDFEVISRIINNITQNENSFLRLQPDESLAGPFGNGWKGVWKWCEDHGHNLDSYLKNVTPIIDFLIVQMDGDVSRKEKEVHCKCVSTVCDCTGVIHPLECHICKEGRCPVLLPCADHKGYAEHLENLIAEWLSISSVSSKIIITIPCDSIDTWVAVAYGDLTDQCETYNNPWETIISRAPYYHNIRIQGKKKRVPVYRELANNVCKNWEIVKAGCLQAQIFEKAVIAIL